MEKPYPRTYHFDIMQVGDHLEVHIPELDITVETASGKMSHQDALDAVHLVVEQRELQEQERSKTVAR